MQTGIIQLSEIYTDLDLTCLLVLYHHRVDPLRLFGRFNNPCFQHSVELNLHFFLIFWVQSIGSLLDWLRNWFQRYSHLFHRTFDTFHISELGWKQVLIFMQQLCNLVNGSNISVISDIGKLWCLLYPNINFFNLDWLTNKWYLNSWSFHISLALCFSDVDLLWIIIVDIDVVATLQFLERRGPFVFFLFHREARCLFEYLLSHNL
jgi:hypothetical protein